MWPVELSTTECMNNMSGSKSAQIKGFLLLRAAQNRLLSWWHTVGSATCFMIAVTCQQCRISKLDTFQLDVNQILDCTYSAIEIKNIFWCLLHGLRICSTVMSWKHLEIVYAHPKMNLQLSQRGSMMMISAEIGWRRQSVTWNDAEAGMTCVAGFSSHFVAILMAAGKQKSALSLLWNRVAATEFAAIKVWWVISIMSAFCPMCLRQDHFIWRWMALAGFFSFFGVLVGFLLMVLCIVCSPWPRRYDMWFGGMLGSKSLNAMLEIVSQHTPSNLVIAEDCAGLGPLAKGCNFLVCFLFVHVCKNIWTM